MNKYIKPTWTVNHFSDITASQLRQHQLKGVIVDLDNTLIPWNQAEASQDMVDWLLHLKEAGIGVHLLSNNTQARVSLVADPLGLTFTANALKPRRKNFALAADQLACDRDEIVVVGDQIMTDVVGANRSGMKSILVKPLVENDNVYTLINRRLERLAMKYLGISREDDWGNQLD